ncbi:MAG: helix-turn-helix transcriptional regulator [Capsulimonadaceae bacterium]|nr:helix-turn-helix transcriptional regulator [Capsulimonadaceae bacterium]
MPQLSEFGQRLRSRREQMGMTTEEVGGIIDATADDLEAIEGGQREISTGDLRGLCSYLCVGDDYLSGKQSLNELEEADKQEAEGMISSVVEAFRGLPNHVTRGVAYREIIDLLDSMAS